MDLKNLVKKLYSLRDLRNAITEVKSLQKKVSVPLVNDTKQTAPQMQQGKEDAKDALKGHKSQLSHVGVDTTRPGHMIHKVGIPGASHLYEIHHDLHAFSKGMPSYTIRKASSAGHIKEMSPKIYETMARAVKDLVNHAYNGSWE